MVSCSSGKIAFCARSLTGCYRSQVTEVQDEFFPTGQCNLYTYTNSTFSSSSLDGSKCSTPCPTFEFPCKFWISQPNVFGVRLWAIGSTAKSSIERKIELETVRLALKTKKNPMYEGRPCAMFLCIIVFEL